MRGVDPLDWARDGPAWPNHDASRFVSAAGLRWHVQQCGDGPGLLLLHGTGASTHSFRDLLRPLAADFTVVAVDLPGHGFSGTASGTATGTAASMIGSPAGGGFGFAGPPAVPDRLLTLPGMARALAAVLAVLDVPPVLVVGHSAGAAVLVQMALDALVRPVRIVALNGALLPFRGVAGTLFSPLARLMARNRLVPRLLAWRAVDRLLVERLLWGTGSALDDDGIGLYARLLRSPGHVAAALGMMANWDLPALERRLPQLTVPLTLMAADNDRTVSPADARAVARRVPGAAVEAIPGLGHLAHEQQPMLIVDRLLDLARGDGVLRPSGA